MARKSARTMLIAETQKLLDRPGRPTGWREALEEAREITAVLGMKPDIRRAQGDSRIIEEAVNSLGTRYSLSIGDEEITRKKARKLLLVENEVDETSGEDDDDHLWLWEEDLAAVLEKLKLTDGWSWKSESSRYRDESQGKYPSFAIIPLGQRRGHLVVRVVTRIDADFVEEFEELSEVPAMPLNAARRKLDELADEHNARALQHLADQRPCEMLLDVEMGTTCPYSAFWLVKGTAMCYRCLHVSARFSTANTSFLAPALAQELLDASLEPVVALDLYQLKAMVHHIGYTESDAQERIDAFLAQPNAALVDIRQTPRSRWRPQWNLSAFLKRYGGEKYAHCPELGNLNFPELPAVFADLDTGVQRVLRVVRGGTSVMLLCACGDYEKCHRKDVYEAMMDALLQYGNDAIEKEEVAQ